MATVFRCKVLSALRNASRSCSFLKTKRPTNVRFLATTAHKKKENFFRNLNQMSVHQVLLLIENQINAKGRLTGGELDSIVSAVQNKESLQNNQVLLLIRCCGSIAANEDPEDRMVYAQKIWDSIKASGVELDISHYNAYLKVQMENQQPISSAEYIKIIENEGLVPNRVTYQYLLTYCCSNGDLVGATELLEIMKSKNYPLNENIFNALVMGHSIVNDVNGAEGIMNIMKEKDILVTSNTYAMLLSGLAISGNIEKMRSVMEECSKQNIEIRGSRLMDVVYYLFVNGHYDYAEELLGSLGKHQNFSDVITLQFRLLHKKNYEGYLRTLPFMSNSEDVINRMRLAFRYLGRKEDFESVLKFKESCDEKGLDVDPIRNILFYSLVNNNSDTSFRIIEHMHKSGQPLKGNYFTPLILRASRSGNIEELLQILITMTYHYAFEVNCDFLMHNVFHHLKFNEKQMHFFIDALSVQINQDIVVTAFMKSALIKGNEQALSFAAKYPPPLKIPNHLLESMVRYLRNGHSPKIIIDILSKWSGVQKSDENRNPSETGKSQADSSGKNGFQEAMDKLAIKIYNQCESSITEEFLNMAEMRNIPISARVLDLIRQKSNDLVESSEAEMSEEGSSADDGTVSDLKENVDAEGTAFNLFMKYKKEGNITEMEKIFNENESVQNHFGFRKMVETLKILNKEDLVKQYLRRYYEKFSQHGVFSRNLFLEAEMVNRGMIKEAVELVDRRFSSVPLRKSSSFIIMEIFVPIFERGNENEIKDFLNAKNSSGGRIISLQDIIDNLVKRGLGAVAVKSLRALDAKDLSTLNLNKALIPGLFNKKQVELLEELTEFVEDNPAFEKSSSQLMYLYACTGKIAKGRELLNSEESVPLQWMRSISAIKPIDRSQVLENAIAIVRGSKSHLKTMIFEFLMVNYHQNSVSPEKALELWLQLQEENAQPTAKFLNTLADILKKNNRDVPFQPPVYSDGFSMIKLPPSFPLNIKLAFWGMPGLGFGAKLNKLTDLLLKNVLTANHVSAILKLNDNLNQAVVKMLNRVSSFIELKKAYEKGTLADFLPKFINDLDGETPENKIKNLPFPFLASLFGLISRQGWRPNFNICQILLWAHWQIVPEMKYVSFAQMLEPNVRELIKSKEIMKNLVQTLEQQPLVQKNYVITSFLLKQKVFREYEDLEKRVENILKGAGLPEVKGESSKVPEPPSNDDFSFQNVFEGQTEGEKTKSAMGSEKTVEKPESADIIQVEGRTSGACPNI